MKKSKLLVLSLLAVSAFSLSACTPKSGSSSSSVGVESQSQQSAQNSATSVSSQSGNNSTNSQTSAEVEKEVVLCAEATNGTVTADKKMAAYGEIVTLTITPDSGYMLESLKVNGKSITGTSFPMPSGSAYVTATFVAIAQSDAMIKGDISVNLEADPVTGIYQAKNVKVANDSFIYFRVGGKDYSSTAINNAKTFANVELPNSNKTGFTISGGSTYDFFFDPKDTAEPISIQRRKVDVLPETPEALETMFGGRAGSETCMFPEGVTSVDYSSNIRQDKYHWDLYEDNSSLAVVSDYGDDEPRDYVYKSIDGNILSVVDTYVEYPNNDGHCITYVEKDDTTAYAGKYEIVNSVELGHKNYQKTAKDATNFVNLYSHTMESIDFDIMYAYRTGFRNDIADDEYKYDIKVSSTANANGGFTTKINSWVSVKPAGSTSAVSSAYHNEFDVTIEFTEAGGLKDLNYVEKQYGASQFDASTGQLIGNPKPQKQKKVKCTYTYGTPKAGKPTFDKTPYFISSIDSLKIVDSLGNDSSVNKMDTIEMYQSATQYIANGKKYVKMEYSPSTAIDVWQYGVESSSDRSVINHKDNNPVLNPYEFVGQGAGTTSLTIGNHTVSGVKGNLDTTITVQEGNIRKIYFMTVYPHSKPDGWTSDTGFVYAGTQDEVYLRATLSNSQTDEHVAIASVSSSAPEILQASYDQTTGVLKLDTTMNPKAVTQDIEVKLTFDASFDPTWPASKTVTITVKPSKNLISDPVGNWNYIDPDGVAAAQGFTGSMVILENGTGKITAKDGSDLYEVTFNYTFNVNEQTFKISNAKSFKNGEAFGYSTSLLMNVDLRNGSEIGVFWAVETKQEYDEAGDANLGEFVIFGDYKDDGDGNYYYELDNFERAK